jgi:hypothetical protein
MLRAGLVIFVVLVIAPVDALARQETPAADSAVRPCVVNGVPVATPKPSGSGATVDVSAIEGMQDKPRHDIRATGGEYRWPGVR